MASVQNEGEEMEAGGDESDDSGVWQPPFAEVEDENGNTPFPVGTLSEISSHVKTTVSTTKKMIDFLKLDSSSVFIDVGCGVGAVSNVVAQEVQCRVLGLDFCENEFILRRSVLKSSPMSMKLPQGLLLLKTYVFWNWSTCPFFEKVCIFLFGQLSR